MQLTRRLPKHRLTPLASGNSFWIYTKDPSVQAFTDLMNRALDKPTEQVQLQEQGAIEIRWKDSSQA